MADNTVRLKHPNGVYVTADKDKLDGLLKAGFTQDNGDETPQRRTRARKPADDTSDK